MSKLQVKRKFKDGRILLEVLELDCLFGYDKTSTDKNRILLYPDGTYKIHSFVGWIPKNRPDLEFEGKSYRFIGYY